MIRSIQEKTGTKIDINEDGTVIIASADGPNADRAREMILAVVEEPEMGRIYTGSSDPRRGLWRVCRNSARQRWPRAVEPAHRSLC